MNHLTAIRQLHLYYQNLRLNTNLDYSAEHGYKKKYILYYVTILLFGFVPK